MNRLFQFLRKLLIAALAGVFISIGTFPGEVTALADSPKSSTPDKALLDVNQHEFEQFRWGLVKREEKCPPSPALPFKNPDFAFSDPPDKNSINLTATEGNLKLGDIEFPNGLLYEGTYHNEAGTLIKFYPTYTPPTIRVSPGRSINLTLTNNLPIIDDVKVPGLPLVEENLMKVSQDTNLHYHGFNVSPLLGSDDVVMHVHSNRTPPDSKKGGYYHWVDKSGKDHISTDFPPITTYKMKVDIPEKHQSGLFWYHPHVHTVSEPQVLGGMSGGIIIEGINEYYDILGGIPLKGQTTPTPLTEQVMLFKDFTQNLGTDQYNCFILNGLVKPNMTIRPGEVQFWRIGNIGADKFLYLQLLEHSSGKQVPFYIFARDGSIVTAPQKIMGDSSCDQNDPSKSPQCYLVPPAGRVELLVVGDKAGVQYDLVSQPFGNQPQYHLATVTTNGSEVEYDIDKPTLDEYITTRRPKQSIDKMLPDPDRLANYPYCEKGKPHSSCIAEKRTFTFLKTNIDSTKPDSPTVFAIANGKYPDDKGEVKPQLQLYDENRIDTTSILGDIEEWTLINYDSDAHHAFHIHQLDFVVTSDPNEQPPIGYRDTIDLPPSSTTVVRIPFVNPFITGVFVYHCHILAHEDRGMMMNIKVIDPKSYQPAFQIKS